MLDPIPTVDSASAPPERGAGSLALVQDLKAYEGRFFSAVAATPLPDPYCVAVSSDAAELLGLRPHEVGSSPLLDLFAGNAVHDSHRSPLAAVYSGHQFGVWAGQLGDGRALLLGAVTHAGERWEVQLKGAGPTPFSRMGDGRAVLRSSIREYLCSEAMHALGIPTTRALCIIGSDYPVIRETVETAAVVTRLSPSFLRFGSFEHWLQRGDEESLKILADEVIARFYPHLEGEEKRYALLLKEVTLATARLIAQWQAVGFCHGVMNTDNMSILGLTLDYGPFGFMEAFDGNFICNHSDTSGRYSYAMQPQVAHWNLYCLGQALVPLIGNVDEAHAALEVYKPEFEDRVREHFCAKLGLVETRESDEQLVDELFRLLQSQHPDFTLFFRDLGAFSCDGELKPGSVRDHFIDRTMFDDWAQRYAARLKEERSEDVTRRARMNRVNPKFILRNYLAEVAIRAAQAKDYREIDRLLSVLRRPFDEQPESAAFAELPPDWATGLEVSCSS